MDFRTTTVAALADDVSAKRISARELVGAALARIEEVDAKINAFVALDGERALADAAALDARLAAGEDVGPLAGIPIGVKDLEDAAGFRTTQGSAVYADSPIADDGLAARRAAQGGRLRRRRQDQHPRGRPQGRHREPALRRHGQPVGPRPRSAGGSSGGSAAAIAAGLVPLCTGSDGGGSIRIPSSVCGISGHEAVARAGADRRAEAAGLGRPVDPRPDGGARSATSRWRSTTVVGPDADRPARRCRCPTRAGAARCNDAARAPQGRLVADPRLRRRSTARSSRSARRRSKVLEGLGTEIVDVDPVFDEDPGMPWLTLAMACDERVARRTCAAPTTGSASTPATSR